MSDTSVRISDFGKKLYCRNCKREVPLHRIEDDPRGVKNHVYRVCCIRDGSGRDQFIVLANPPLLSTCKLPDMEMGDYWYGELTFANKYFQRNPS